MRELKSSCRVAVVQAAPIMFDKDKCVDKALELILIKYQETGH